MKTIGIKTNKKMSHHLTQEDINDCNDIELERISKSKLFDDFYEFLDNSISFILRTIVFLFRMSGIYILWISLDYFSAHLYVKFCVPNSFIGFIMSPLMISTPHCQGLRWMLRGHTINNIFINDLKT